MTDDEFLAAFEACTLTRPEWTHAAHVRMAWLYLRRLPVPDALERVRGGIRRLNAALGSDGYHDTITVAFVSVIAARLGGADTFDTFRDRHPDLFDRTLPALRKHYTAARMYSAAAKEHFVEPDAEPLPG